MSNKKRLDVAMTEQGLAESRQKAQAVIMAGQVYVDGQKVDKAGAPVGESARIEVRGKTMPYVSRGGLKLEKAMACWPIVWRGQSVPISALPQEDLPIVCSKTGRLRYSRWMWAITSWTGGSGLIQRSSAWSAPMPDT